MKTYKTNEFIKILRNNGYKQMESGKGSHMRFVNRHTRKSIMIPVNSSDLNPALTAGIIKRNKLNIR